MRALLRGPFMCKTTSEFSYGMSKNMSLTAREASLKGVSAQDEELDVLTHS